MWVVIKKAVAMGLLGTACLIFMPGPQTVISTIEFASSCHCIGKNPVFSISDLLVLRPPFEWFKYFCMNYNDRSTYASVIFIYSLPLAIFS